MSPRRRCRRSLCAGKAAASLEQRAPKLDTSLPGLWRLRRYRFPSPPSAAFPTLSTALGASQYWFRIMYSSGIIRLQERINSVYLIGFKAAYLKQPGALPLSGSGAGAGSCVNQWEFSTAEPVLPKPGSESRLPGGTFLCHSAVSPACHATEPAGAAVQRVQPPPSRNFKGCCWGARCGRTLGASL